MLNNFFIFPAVLFGILKELFYVSNDTKIINHYKDKEINMATKNKIQENTHGNNTKNRGFASMPHEKVEEIARKGGQASAQKAGHEGMAARGRAGGNASAAKAGHEGMAARGRIGGQTSAERAGHQGMAERGRMGGHASSSSKHSHEEEE